MIRIPSHRAGRLLGAVVLLLAGASCWWVWTAWDRVPYDVWQVAGCVLSLITVAVVAARRLPAWIVVPAVPVGFTAAWVATASARDSSGLWAVGAVLVFAGTLLGAAVVVAAARFLRRRTAA